MKDYSELSASELREAVIRCLKPSQKKILYSALKSLGPHAPNWVIIKTTLETGLKLMFHQP